MLSCVPNPRSSPRVKRPRPPPLVLGNIDEEATPSEYDVGGLDLGAESPRSTSSATNLLESNAFVRHWAEARVPYWNMLRRTPSYPKERQRSSQRDDDRDCGICFEYAVRPCRTLCCGKIFCTEHLADWLHGPNAEGRCPHCENACSLVGSTLPLSPLSLLQPSASSHTKRQTLTPSNYGAFHSPLVPVQSQPNDSQKRQHPLSIQTGKEVTPRAATVTQSTTPSTSTAVSFELSGSSSDEESIRQHYRRLRFTQPGSASTSAINLSTTPFSQSWGAVSRLMSIVTFLMFLYKLLS